MSISMSVPRLVGSRGVGGDQNSGSLAPKRNRAHQTPISSRTKCWRRFSLDSERPPQCSVQPRYEKIHGKVNGEKENADRHKNHYAHEMRPHQRNEISAITMVPRNWKQLSMRC